MIHLPGVWSPPEGSWGPNPPCLGGGARPEAASVTGTESPWDVGQRRGRRRADPLARTTRGRGRPPTTAALGPPIEPEAGKRRYGRRGKCPSGCVAGAAAVRRRRGRVGRRQDGSPPRGSAARRGRDRARANQACRCSGCGRRAWRPRAMRASWSVSSPAWRRCVTDLPCLALPCLAWPCLAASTSASPPLQAAHDYRR